MICLELKNILVTLMEFGHYLNMNLNQTIIFHNLSDGIIKNGENELIIKYEDGVGNKGVYQTKVYY